MEISILAATPDPDRVIADAARTCYLSFGRAGEDSDRRLIRNLVRLGHHSVLEHASVTFRVRGCTRAFTHQLVRHRLCSFSQQSQRYVDEQDFEVVVPDSIGARPEALELFRRTVESVREAYAAFRRMGIPGEDARFVLPNAVTSEIVFSANFRQLRHMIRLRGERRAQWEIRRVFVEILRLMKERSPLVFGDLEIDAERECVVVVPGDG
ncbi:MAG TPA: FAD-dependent thymidylate synthase [bacterium]|nr:FAD-dependent thymidylate synthase [bacterium]HPQ67291.1 FAD-dependent thymidylate synthase [bacterium]